MRYFVGLMVRMAIRPACVFLLFLLCFKCIAQKDSLYTDTVIIVQPPVVIKKQVHVSVTDYIKEESSLELGAYYSVNWNLIPTSNTTNSAFHSAGLQARYAIGSLQIAAGLGTLRTRVSYNETYTTVVEATRMDTSYKILDCYWIVDQGQLKYICAADTVLSQVKETSVTSHHLQHQDQVQYVQVPLSVSYQFKTGDWSLSPGVQAIYHKRTSSTDEFWKWKESMWLLGTEIRLGYLFRSHLLTELKVEYKKNLTPLNESEGNKQHWNLLGLGIGLYYRF